MNQTNLIEMMLTTTTTGHQANGGSSSTVSASPPLSPKRTASDNEDHCQVRSYKRLRRNISNDDTSSKNKHLVLQVPQDYASLEDAIDFANQEFQRAHLNSECDTTITIRIDPNCGTLEMQSCLEVRAVGKGALLVLTSAGPQPASLVLETRTPNQPLVKLVQGKLELQNLSLEHSSTVDLITLVTRANHNAAVVVGRPVTEHQQAAESVSLKNVVLRSYTGKGIINHNSSCKVIQDDLRIFNPLY